MRNRCIGLSVGNWFAVALTIFGIVLSESTAAAADYWPTETWRHSPPEAQGVQSKPLADMLAKIQEREWRIDSVTVVRNGHVVLDAYFHPFQAGLKHAIRSNSKSVMSALIGIALGRGEIKSVAQPVLEFFPDKTVANVDARKQAMTLEHLLTMTAGFDCKDNYLHGWSGLKEMRRSPDWAQYVLDLPMIQAPGTGFEYCNGVSFLLSAILQKATGVKALDYAKKHLFEPLGISDVIWPETPRGTTVGYGGILLTPHDMAKFGLLYLNKGKWDGRQIVPAAWVETSTQRHVDATLFRHYGYQWWSDGAGYHMGVGYRGQFIFVVPDKNLVAVFTSDLPGMSFYIPSNLLVEFILPALRSDAALAANPARHKALGAAVEQAARGPSEGYFWDTASDGVLRDGRFVRTSAPAFTLRLPPGSRKDVQNEWQQVMRVKGPEGYGMSASVDDIPDDLTLAEIGPQFLAKRLRDVGRDVKVISNRPTVLGDGVPAYRSEFAWRFRGWELTTHAVTAIKDRKLVSVQTRSLKGTRNASDFIGTLRFDGGG